MNRLATIAFVMTIAVNATGCAADWTNTFPVKKESLASVGTNPFFILRPGYSLQLKGDKETLTITVLAETKRVDGVETRVVQEREENNGQLVEISRNYFAIDKTTDDVYYFGEDVDIYRDGKVVSHEGAWLSGIDGATFGMMMPGKPKKGDKFYQELAPNVAMDHCEIVSTDVQFTTPAGEFRHCLRVKETSPIERGTSIKHYAPGVGLLQDEGLLLVKVVKPKGR